MRIETIRQLFRNFLSLGISRIVTGALYFTLTVYLARILGVENFGKYEFSIAFYVIFNLVSALGLNKIGTRDISRMHSAPVEQVRAYTNNLVSMRFVSSSAAFLVLCAAAFLIPKPADIKMLIILNGITLLFSFVSLEWFFMGIEKMSFVAYSRILKALGFLIFSLIFVRSSGDVLIIPAVRNTAVFFAIFFLVAVYRRTWGKIEFSYDRDKWKVLFVKACPMLIAGIMAKVYLKFDAIMIGFMMGEKEVGLYVAIYRIILFLMGIRALGISSLFPALSRLAPAGGKALKNIVYLSEKALIAVAVPIGVGGTILAYRIVVLVFGKAYAGGVTAFQVLIWAFVLLGVNFVFPQLQIAINKQKRYMYISSAGVLANIILNLILIPVMGIKGAAAATVMAELITFVFFYRLAGEVVRIDLLKLVMKPFIASLLFGIPLFVFRDANIFLSIPLSAALYFALLYFSGYIRKNELATFGEVFGIKRGIL